MNREERRRTGITKETSDKLEELKKPCTLLEAVQLAQGVADDKIKDYHNNINPIIVSLTIQIEVLKEMLFKCTSDPSHASVVIGFQQLYYKHDKSSDQSKIMYPILFF